MRLSKLSKRIADAAFAITGLSFVGSIACFPITTTLGLVARHTPWLNEHQEKLEQLLVMNNAHALVSLGLFYALGVVFDREERNPLDPYPPDYSCPELKEIERNLFRLINNPQMVGGGESARQVIHSLQLLLDLERVRRYGGNPRPPLTPCSNCHFYSGDVHLRCAVNPLGDPAHCTDWEAKSEEEP